MIFAVSSYGLLAQGSCGTALRLARGILRDQWIIGVWFGDVDWLWVVSIGII